MRHHHTVITACVTAISFMCLFAFFQQTPLGKRNVTTNIFANVPATLPKELFEILVYTENIRIERIVSKGHTTDWYDQEENEWVILLKGAARLTFSDESEVTLKEGDFIQIPTHLKHRVSWTPPDVKTIWLAIFY